MTVRRIAYTAARTLVVESYEATPPPAGSVRLDVAYTGICGTDLHIYHGAMDHRVDPPGVIGHEMSGRVAEVGEGVSGWSVGDHVTVMPLAPCGDCPACAAGHSHICHRLVFIGIDADGSMQNSWTVPAHTLIRLPSDLRLDHAALVEPTAVALHDVRRAGLVSGERALVVGGGPIGLLIGLVARRVGAEVLLAEPNGFRRSIADSVGLATVDPSTGGLDETVDGWTGGAGADVAFEVSGAAGGVTAAVASLATRGRLVQVAIHPTLREVDLHRFFWRELTLIGARLYEREDFESAVGLLAEGTVPAEVLISGIEPLDRAVHAFESLDSGGGVMKVLVDCRTATEAVAL